MKNLKKVLVCVMAVATLGCISLMPISSNAEIYGDGGVVLDSTIKDSSFYGFTDDYEWIKNNGIEEAVFIIIQDQVSTTYYYNGNDGMTFPQSDVEIPNDVEKVITIDFDNFTINGCGEAGCIYSVHFDSYTDEETGVFHEELNYIEVELCLLRDNCSYYDTVYYNTSGNYWYAPISFNPIPQDDDITIGESEDSITAFTIGDSVYPRGDINLDGKANTADLLYLKKYLLGLIEW
ncbi:MAG: hypothetical protein LUG94_02935 [Ruminococcus sp.]|nr:hypothetical protein [Ruminococcus sp.]